MTDLYTGLGRDRALGRNGRRWFSAPAQQNGHNDVICWTAALKQFVHDYVSIAANYI